MSCFFQSAPPSQSLSNFLIPRWVNPRIRSDPHGWILSEDYHRHTQFSWKARVSHTSVTEYENLESTPECKPSLHCVELTSKYTFSSDVPSAPGKVITLPAWPFPSDPQLDTPKSDSKAPSPKPVPLLLSPSQEVHFSVPWVYDLGAMCDPMHS